MFNIVIGHLPQFQDVKLLVEDIGELKPTIFCAVPRVLDRIYSGANFFLHLNVLIESNSVSFSKYNNQSEKHLHQNQIMCSRLPHSQS